MPNVIKLIGGILLTCAVIWALVLGWWQSNDYEPSRLDLALYLGALPLAVIGGYLLLRGFIDHLKTPSLSASQEPAPLRDDDPLASAPAKTAAEERAYQVCLIESFVESAVGRSADDVIEAIKAGRRPEPSENLTDDAGFPVFAAEVKGIDFAAKEDSLSENPVVKKLFGDGAQVRLFALLDSVLLRANESLERFFSATPQLSRLNVIWLVPEQISEKNLAELQAWVRLRYWPKLSASQIFVSLRRVSNENDAIRELDEVILNSNRNSSDREMTLIVAAVSSVDSETVARMESSGRLFSAAHQERKIVGEGAVALLLGNEATCESFSIEEAASCSRISVSVRDKSVDAGGRVSGKLLGQLIAGLLDVIGTESDAIKTVVADTDHRANRVAELLDGLSTPFEHLDPIKDCLAIGTVTGDFSPFGPLLAAACAYGRTLADDAPVLCVSNQHETHRAVFLIGKNTIALDPNIQVTSS